MSEKKPLPTKFKKRYKPVQKKKKYGENFFGSKSYKIPHRKPLREMLKDNPNLYEEPKMPKNFKPGINREEEKSRLAKIFSGEREIEELMKKRIKERQAFARTYKKRDEFQILFEEIEERAKWLKEMKDLGEGKKYEAMIQSQIADKLQQMKTLDKKKTESEMKGIVTKYELDLS